MFPSSFWTNLKIVQMTDVKIQRISTVFIVTYTVIHRKKDISVCHVISILCFNHMAKCGTITYLIQRNLYFSFTSFTMF